MYALGVYKLEGKYLQQDYREAEKLLKEVGKVIERIHDTKMYSLGWRQVKRELLKRDPVEVETFLKKAMKIHGVYSAMHLLGLYKMDGTLSRNVEEAEQWFRRAATAGYRKSMYVLGRCKLEGSIFKQDIEEGEKWLTRAAFMGLPEAMNELGERKLKGDILTQDLKEGKKWLEKAEKLLDNDEFYQT